MKRKTVRTPARATFASGTPAERANLERSALLAVRTLVDRMRTLYGELERMTGAPITVHRALTRIGEEPGIAASSLADALGMQRPAVSHLLRALSERGWIERKRHADDQRSVRLHLSAGGRELLNATGGRAVGTLQRAVRQLSRRQLEGVAQGVGAIIMHLPPPAPVSKYVRKYGRRAGPGR
jgi:DNA-binding MarR family transcriptional regulator